MHAQQDAEALERQHDNYSLVPDASHAGQDGIGTTATQLHAQHQEAGPTASPGHVQQQENGAPVSHSHVQQHGSNRNPSQGHVQQQEAGAEASQGHAQQQRVASTVSEGHGKQQVSGTTVRQGHLQQQGNSVAVSDGHVQQHGHSATALQEHVQQQQSAATAPQGHEQQHQQDGNSHATRDEVLELMRGEMWAECMALLQRLRSEVHGRQLNTPTASVIGTANAQQQQQQQLGSAMKDSQQQQRQQGQEQGDCAVAQAQGQELGVTTGQHGGASVHPDGDNSLDMWVHGREATQAWVIAGLRVHAAARQWAQALQLEPQVMHAAAATAMPAAGRAGGGQGNTAGAWSVAQDRLPQQALDEQAAAVRRAHRRVAALVHPDKCSLLHAKQAFELASLLAHDCWMAWVLRLASLVCMVRREGKDWGRSITGRIHGMPLSSMHPRGPDHDSLST